MSIEDTYTPNEFTPEMQALLDAQEHGAEDSVDGDAETQSAAPTPAPESKPDTADHQQPRDQKGQFIPKARFDEALARERERNAALTQQLNELRTSSAAADPTGAGSGVQELEAELDRLLDAREDFVQEGEVDKAKQISREITRLTRAISRLEVGSEVAATQIASVDSQLFANTVQTLEAMYPQLATTSPEFDPAVISMIMGVKSANMTANPNIVEAQALYDATVTVMTRFGAAPPPQNTGAVKGTPRSAQISRNVATLSRQPANMNVTGTNTTQYDDQVDLSKMHPSQWSKLSVDQQNKLLGIT